jgi:hypothetical protein
LLCFSSYPITYMYVCALLKADKEKITFQRFRNYPKEGMMNFYFIFPKIN